MQWPAWLRYDGGTVEAWRTVDYFINHRPSSSPAQPSPAQHCSSFMLTFSSVPASYWSSQPWSCKSLCRYWLVVGRINEADARI